MSGPSNFSFNMNSNPWMGLVPQGLGSFIFGNNSCSGMEFFGLNNSIFSGGNYFTNCYGQVDYDALAGFGAVTSMLNIAGYVYSQHKAQQEPKVDYETEIENINKSIAEYKAIDPEEKIDEKYTTNITNAKNTSDTISSEMIKLRDEIAKLTKQSAEKPDDTTINSQLANKTKQLEEKTAEYDKLNGDENVEGSIKYYEKQKADAIKAKKEEIEAEIKKLEDKKQEYLNKMNDEVLDDADGSKWQRTSEDDFNKLFDQDGNFISRIPSGKKDANGNDIYKNVKVGKSDVRFAILGYRNAKTEEEKEMWADKFKILYNELSLEDQKNTELTAAYKIICDLG